MTWRLGRNFASADSLHQSESAASMNPIEILLLLLSSPILGVFCYVVPHTYDSLGLTGNQYYPLVLWHGLGGYYFLDPCPCILPILTCFKNRGYI